MLRQLIFVILRYSLVPAVIREIFQRNKITIAMYHNIDSALFEKHVAVLIKRYNIISLQDFIKAKEDHKIRLPKKSLIITFDDGFKENSQLLPVLKKNSVPVTIFLCSSVVDTNRSFWFYVKVRGFTFEQLAKMPLDERDSVLSTAGYDERKELQKREVLCKSEIMGMSPYVDFQSHTQFHPVLPQCSPERAEKEILESKNDLSKMFNFNINAIAYPNGDYSDREISYAKNAGYKIGLTTNGNYNTVETDSFKIKRIWIYDKADINEALVRISGTWTFFSNIKLRLRK